MLERSDRGLILGEDDRHLDFKVSVLLRPAFGQERDELVTTTVVHCHNLLGRSYLALIRPVRHQVVQANLRGAARHGWPEVTSKG